MTSTRRKTFATPLEFWQWAIMEPGKRKAKNQKDLVVFVDIDDTGRVVLRTSEGFDAWLEDCLCPLTAVEDEHGAIEEEKGRSSDELTKWLEELAHCAVTKDVQEIFTAASSLASEIRKLIDEEIAAATVEIADWNGSTKRWEFTPRPLGYRLKPKGDV